MTFKELHQKTEIDKIKTTPLKSVPSSWIKIYFKSYPRFKKIDLPEPSRESRPLYELISTRCSRREFNKNPISIKQLSTLLFFSAGIINADSVTSLDDTRRAYPCAGARYPLELYVAIQNCDGVESGVYHYNVLSHSLELLISGNQLTQLNEFISQDMVLSASALLIISSPFERTQVKYGVRSYRYVHLDAGHLAQNLYFVAQNLNLGCCTIGGFIDKEIDAFFDFPEDETTIYLGVIGNYD